MHADGHFYNPQTDLKKNLPPGLEVGIFSLAAGPRILNSSVTDFGRALVPGFAKVIISMREYVVKLVFFAAGAERST